LTVADKSRPRLRRLDLTDYADVLADMSAFTDRRDADTEDEIWLVQHRPVFTLGMSADASHVLDAGDIPVIRVDRGGQVTYHGPGQLLAYVLLDLRRARIGIRELVTALETAVVETVASYGIDASSRRDAPGVYVQGAKLASVGLRVRRGCSYHGIAINVNMDLGPFARINPCGFSDIEVTQVADLGGPTSLSTVSDDLIPKLLALLGAD
jgi:lipoyl(octanoyl) transferase